MFVRMSTGDRTDDQDRILSRDELDRLDRNLFLLSTLLDVNNTRLLDSLVRDRCITDRHRDRIQSKLLKGERNEELLSIIRRRSYSNFTTLIDALKRRKQDKAVQLLEQQTGRFRLVNICCQSFEGGVIVTYLSSSPSLERHIRYKQAYSWFSDNFLKAGSPFKTYWNIE